MNSTEFEQRNLLVGQKGASQSYGVSSDPMLMGMLSTGLYSRPFRTMIQEIMFNAWDAHRMGNCQDKPIDIYIDDTTGLMVRDYGPGIHPDDMTPIYCMYGNSTKRNDKGQTGGFGLGSKSPFAYSDSFTVTSFHDGLKNMYLMNRVSKENGGAPSMTPLVSDIETDETGLLVSIPLKNERDIDVAYEHIKDVLFLSGIMVNLHFKDQPVEQIVSETMDGRSFFSLDNRSEFSPVMAVYGGVRYSIEDHVDFEDSYREVYEIAKVLGTTYISFPPDSLTPLPNREGLNMSDKTIESIKERFEIIIEAFQKAITPVIHTVLEFTLDKYDKIFQVPPTKAMYAWALLGKDSRYGSTVFSNCNDLYPIRTQEQLEFFKTLEKPEDVHDNMWASLLELAFKDTSKVRNLMNDKNFEAVKRKVFLKKYPKLVSQYHECLNYDFTLSSISVQRINSMNETRKLIRDFSEIENALDKKITLRAFNGGSTYEILTNVRGERNTNGTHLYTLRNLPEGVLDHQTKKNKHNSDKRKFTDMLWMKRNGEEYDHPILPNAIILAKSVGSLTDYRVKEETVFRMFAGGYAKLGDNSEWKYRSLVNPSAYVSGRCKLRKMIPAIVTGKAKNNYDATKKYFKDLGYKIIEVAEPVKIPVEKLMKDTTPVVPTGPRKYTVLSFSGSYRYSTTWTDYDAIEVEKPEAYLVATESEINNYNFRGSEREFFTRVANLWPKTALLKSKNREGAIVKKRIPHITVKIGAEIEKLLADKERIKKMVLYSQIKDESGIPSVLLDDFPELQKAMKLPYIRTNHREKFFNDYRFLMNVDHLYRGIFREIYTKYHHVINNAFHDAKKDLTPEQIKLCKQVKILDAEHLSRVARSMKKGERKVLSEKIVRFLRTF
ncbi:RIIA lysis inhibitor [Sulfitobacter phage phiCB2047-B]|uniref:RIIA protein n=1 Tax=Sulfitobacter phage phiCB2047-B TaxID=754046 RepID=M4PRN4_9CAUD|nr:RIIA lysis inhibitor [Sulfitobacter phage phiCB2047-B]AGH07406.1 rIIA protein [Sulfitobacter phage phiCB2047-B]